MTWQSLEQRIRDISALQFGKAGEKETINGVDLDCVIKLDAGRWIIVEISKRRDLEKVRIDVNRLILVRRHLYDKSNIMSKCYFVCLFEPTKAMKEAGAPHHIDVLSQKEFEQQFFDFSNYVAARTKIQFGSSVHPITGEPDATQYVPVKYIRQDDEKELDIKEIAKIISNGGNIVLTGEYGSGKSRCLREAFFTLTSDDQSAYFLAIDLKTTWGLETAEELIRRHFDLIGLSNEADFAIRAFHNNNIKFLLDGFDEVGTQAWSDNPLTLRRIRTNSLRGVRDLIKSVGNGVLIAGREHYFNSSDELMECLGLAPDNCLRIQCNGEFNDEELQQFLSQISDRTFVVPDWLPKRPLMCQAIAALDAIQLSEILESEHGDISFWNALIEILCEREARIREILDSNTIKMILVHLARLTRAKEANVGPISYSDIQNAFESVLGTHPVEEASVLLQRLPGLGRTSLDNDDRQFIDTYILDGLRALDLNNSIKNYDMSLKNEVWRNPLDVLGQRVLVDCIVKEENKNNALRFSHSINDGKNKIAVCDIVCTLCWINQDETDFQNMTVVDGEMLFIDLSLIEPRNLIISDTIIFNMVFPSHPISGIQVVSCQTGQAFGVSSPSGLPDWVRETEIHEYESVDTVSAIKNASLSPQHKILVTILKKTFFQPGAGRQEAALLRGLGQVDGRGYTDRILNKLISEGLLTKVPGKHGNLFIPNRKYKSRVGKILSQLNLSEDKLWLEFTG